MIIGNVEGDELLMQICMSVGKRKYSLKFPSGFKYPLHGRYRDSGRFNRKSIERVLAKLDKVGEVCEIVLDVDYTDKEDLGIMLLEKQIRKLQYLTKADRLDFYVGDGTNFRFKSAKTQPYKAGREEKPVFLLHLRDYLINVHGAIPATGYEADDMLGIYQTKDSIAIHCDKDINQIPGQHFNTINDVLWFCDELGSLRYDNSKLTGTGLAWFYAQMLLGDKTDNIPNLKRGMGEKTVYELLKNCRHEGEYLAKIYELFYEEDNSLARLHEQADLVWICRNRKEKGSGYVHKKLITRGYL